jgi:hypothetical protein
LGWACEAVLVEGLSGVRFAGTEEKISRDGPIPREISHAYGETIHEVSLEQMTGTQGSGSIFDPKLTTPKCSFLSYQLQAQSLIYKILGESAEKLQNDPSVHTECVPSNPCVIE